MPQKFICSNCKNDIIVEDVKSGTSIMCKNCGEINVVPTDINTVSSDSSKETISPLQEHEGSNDESKLKNMNNTDDSRQKIKNESKRKRIVIVSSVGIFIIIIAVLFYFWSKIESVKQEKYYFNTMFDTCCYYLTMNSDNARKLSSYDTQKLVNTIISNMMNRAKNRKELDRYKKAMLYGVITFSDLYDEMVGPYQKEWEALEGLPFGFNPFGQTAMTILDRYKNADDRFKRYVNVNKEKIKEAGWQNYLKSKKFEE